MSSRLESATECSSAGHKSPQRRAFYGGAGKATIIVMSSDQAPALAGFAADGGFLRRPHAMHAAS